VPDRDPDEQFVRRAQRGDRVAFELLVERHANKLFSLAARSLGSRQDAEDAVQEAFIRAWRGLGSFRGGSLFSTWLYRICLNAVHDQRTRRGSPSAELDPEDAADPRDRFVEQELSGELQAALDALGEPYRTAVLLADLLGCSYDEVASATDTPVGTVKSRIFRGRTELARLLGTEAADRESKDR
jgi:RNA polymerase sigma-70 factor (ECF subfamily)